ncbi:MAG: protein translocase subunit SecD [Planctomycetota bacterium]|nr:protein translocase subunit SecD [Planctomycetota bacterium]
MLENARRQFFLVLFAILLGVASIAFLQPSLGNDLKGGTQLLYDVPADVLDELVTKENASKDSVMAQTISVMRERIDPNGTLDPLITRSGETGILVELSYFENPQDLKRVLDRISNLGRLEMRMVAYDGWAKEADAITAPRLKAEKERLDAWLKTPENAALIAKDPRNIRRYNEDLTAGPLLKFLNWYPREILPSPTDSSRWDTSYADSPKLGAVTAQAFDEAQWNAGVIPEATLKLDVKERRLIEFVAINMKERSFSGEDLDPAGVGRGQGDDGTPCVNYEIVGALQAAYADWSEEHKDRESAIILNGYIKSAPTFISKIPGRGRITGSFTVDEVDELVKVLRTGSLRIEPEKLSQTTIGPSLGEAAIQRGLWSIVGGGVLVFAFMLAFYKIAGTIACVALLLNVFLLYAGILFMQATITLPGLGGIVLTLGMAVDANVLIYERIREELQKGKEMLQAVRSGFERAMSAILDSNITTFLVGLVLFNVGVGPVRGFAVTLMVGIVTTVFTQFFVSRLLFHWALSNNKLDGWKPNTLFENRSIDFVGKIRACVALSALVILGGIGYSMTVPPEEKLSIDFTGGSNLQMVLAEPTDADSVRATLSGDAEFLAAYPTYSVNPFGEEGTGYNIRLKLTGAQRDEIDSQREAWRQTRKEYLAKLTDENISEEDRAALEPPAAYTPPYLDALERVFGGKLVEPAFSGKLLVPKLDQKTQAFAKIDVHFARPVVVAQVKERLTQTLQAGEVTSLGDAAAETGKDFRVEWTTPSSTRPWQLAELVSAELADLTDASGAQIVLSDPFPEAQEIQGRLVDDLRNAAIGALILAWGLIVLYLRVRFLEYKYGLAAVVALIHDVLVTFGVVVLCNHLGLVSAEISLAMIACFLTIIGYSVNDTIVVFDRIRENRIENARNGVDESFRSLINRSLNQTLSRTVLTTVLTLFVVIAQLIVNFNSGSDLEAFAFAMTIGMCCGVYSTMYIAAPILIWMDRGDPVEVPDDPRDPEREGDYDNEAELAAQEAAAAKEA